MKDLIKTACAKSHYVTLFIFTMLASLFFTLAGQLEMFSFGVISKKGADFFELFAPLEDNRLVPQNQVKKEDLVARFDAIDRDHTGIVTKDDASSFIAKHVRQGAVDRGLQFINTILPIESNVWYLVAILVSVALLKAITLFAWRFGTRVLAIRISRDLRQSYFEHLQQMPMSFYQEHNIGSLSSRIVTDATMIADGINSMLINYLQTPFALITTFSLCFFISWQLSVIVFFGFPLLIAPIIFLARRIKRIAKQIQKKQEAFASVLI
jgi:ABC-type multidrug transport system fused ATPase/permease subunit